MDNLSTSGAGSINPLGRNCELRVRPHAVSFHDIPQYVQPLLFDDPERDPFERNKNAMRARAKEIPGERERESEAIKARFANPQARMFPLAVTYLLPKKSADASRSRRT